MFTTIVIFLALLSLLIFVHELGHYVMAKRSGMKVHEFGFGFPPRLFGIRKENGRWKIVGRKSVSTENTIYSINVIPLGGFVKIMGEDSEANDVPDSFVSKSFRARFATVAAGVIMNVLLAWVLLTTGFIYGMPVAIGEISELSKGAQFTNSQVAIVDVYEGSPAEKAGVKTGDLVKSVDGVEISELTQLQDYVKSKPGQDVMLLVRRGTEELTLGAQLPKATELDQPYLGVELVNYGTLRFGPLRAIYHGAQATVEQLLAIGKGLASIFTNGDAFKNLGGPVKIAQLTGEVANHGVIPLLQFAALLSLNLAILNSLPVPALDGGRMLFLIIEKLRGKRNNAMMEQYANLIGFVVLLVLMLAVTARDVWQLDAVKQLLG